MSESESGIASESESGCEEGEIESVSVKVSGRVRVL